MMTTSNITLCSCGGWAVRRRDDGELVLVSPWSGWDALLSRPADVAILLEIGGDPAGAGALVSSMLAGLLVGDCDGE